MNTPTTACLVLWIELLVTDEPVGLRPMIHFAVLSQTSLPRPVKASEPSGIRTGDMRANCAAGRLIEGSQRV